MTTREYRLPEEGGINVAGKNVNIYDTEVRKRKTRNIEKRKTKLLGNG